jgi:hypothetical protein
MKSTSVGTQKSNKGSWRRWLAASVLFGVLVALLAACGAASPTPTTAPTAAAAATATPTTAPARPTETAAPADTVAPPSTDLTDVDESGSTRIDQDALDAVLSDTAAGTLSEAEVEGLLYMREEEKLARDVYLTLYEAWGLGIFQNIAESEATHMEAVRSLIERYGLEDPAEDKGVGIFVDETLQGLYDQLVAEGSQSLANALRVGAAIEEIDILDLQEYSEQTDEPEIQLVYENLTKGSRNHLRSFVSTLDRQAGESYQPQYLDTATYDAIVGSETERGRGN